MKYSDEWGEKSPEPGEQRGEIAFQSKSPGWEGKDDEGWMGLVLIILTAHIHWALAEGEALSCQGFYML